MFLLYEADMPKSNYGGAIGILALNAKIPSSQVVQDLYPCHKLLLTIQGQKRGKHEYNSYTRHDLEATFLEKDMATTETKLIGANLVHETVF